MPRVSDFPRQLSLLCIVLWLATVAGLAEVPKNGIYSSDDLLIPAPKLNTDLNGNSVGFSVSPATSATLLTLYTSPCGIRAPHWHPRANEFFHLVFGEMKVGMIFENGTSFTTLLRAGESIVFPYGLPHYLVNMGCQQNLGYGWFDNVNFGTVLLAPTAQGLPDGIQSAFWTDPVPKIVPGSEAFGQDSECLARCRR